MCIRPGGCRVPGLRTESPPGAIRRRPGYSFPCLHRPDARSRPRGPHRGRRRNASSGASRTSPHQAACLKNYNSQKPMRPCAQGHTVFVPTGSPRAPRSRARKQRTRAWDNYNSQKAPRPRAPSHRAILPPQSLGTKNSGPRQPHFPETTAAPRGRLHRAFGSYNSPRASRQHAQPAEKRRTRDSGNHTSQKQPRPRWRKQMTFPAPLQLPGCLEATRTSPKDKEHELQATTLPRTSCDPAQKGRGLYSPTTTPRVHRGHAQSRKTM